MALYVFVGKKKKEAWRRNLFCTLTHILWVRFLETVSEMLRATAECSRKGSEAGVRRTGKGSSAACHQLLSHSRKELWSSPAFRELSWSPASGAQVLPVTGLKPWSWWLPSAEDSCGTGAHL